MKCLNTPYIKAFVENSFIKETTTGYTECYIHGIVALPGRPHLFNIHTIDGALYSRLPIHSLVWGIPNSWFVALILEPWGVIGHESEIIIYDYLKDARVKIPSFGEIGRYVFTIEPISGAFAEDPEQQKSLHFIEVNNGQFALLPNNMLELKDAHFTNKEPLPPYKRNKIYFLTNG